MDDTTLEGITLDDLAKANVPVLFDTSAILGYFSEPEPTNPHESRESSVGRVSFMESIVKQIKNRSQFYITTNVQDEMAVPKRDENYIIRWIMKKGYCEGDPILELYRQREREIRTRAEFLEAFRKEGRVINSGGKREIDNNNGERMLNHRERRVYQKIKERFDPLKGSFELADTDFDLLISSLAISIGNRTPVTLITNDFGIIRAGRVISDSREQDNLVRYMSRPLQFSFQLENDYH